MQYLLTKYFEIPCIQVRLDYIVNIMKLINFSLFSQNKSYADPVVYQWQY